jgi:hypothetical protein
MARRHDEPLLPLLSQFCAASPLPHHPVRLQRLHELPVGFFLIASRLPPSAASISNQAAYSQKGRRC